MKHLTRALEGKDWLCAGRFTMADVCTVYALLLAKDLGLDYKFSPEIAAYWERATSRPGYLAAQAAQEA